MRISLTFLSFRLSTGFQSVSETYQCSHKCKQYGSLSPQVGLKHCFWGEIKKRRRYNQCSVLAYRFDLFLSTTFLRNPLKKRQEETTLHESFRTKFESDQHFDLISKARSPFPFLFFDMVPIWIVGINILKISFGVKVSWIAIILLWVRVCGIYIHWLTLNTLKKCSGNCIIIPKNIDNYFHNFNHLKKILSWYYQVSNQDCWHSGYQYYKLSTNNDTDT